MVEVSRDKQGGWRLIGRCHSRELRYTEDGEEEPPPSGWGWGDLGLWDDGGRAESGRGPDRDQTSGREEGLKRWEVAAL